MLEVPGKGAYSYLRATALTLNVLRNVLACTHRLSSSYGRISPRITAGRSSCITLLKPSFPKEGTEAQVPVTRC